MYLKQIKAYGFKSFADKIEIDFGKNINGIVGPNGSGKSNIVDAVRWVLGEQSMKSLRADSNTDVIFSGSKTRKPLNSAMVSLVFDNTDRHLNIDFNEVVIKRISFRSGENEYYINSERCRLKDITDLFTDSGAAKESFNIISQGKIEEILSTKPVDRRVIFEEAAGVLKYKKRKEEAIRKLDRTNVNINRVNDIINELEVSLEPLKTQSDKANKYLETKDKLKEIEIALIVNDISKIDYEYKESKIKIDKLNDEIIELSKNNTNYDISLINDKNKLREIEEKINKIQQEILELTKKIETINTDIRLFEEREKYNDSNKINANIINLRKEEVRLNNLITDIKNEIEISKLKIDNELINKLNIDYNDLKTKELNINNKIIENNRKIADIKYTINLLEESINNNNTLPSSIKNILNNKKIEGVYDVIGKLIETTDNYSLAVSTSLGGASSYLVVENTLVAKKLVEYLKEYNLGRATFYPLNVIKPRYIDSTTYYKISNMKGYVNTLDKLVTYDKKYENAILNQLGSVIVVSDIISANEISKIIEHKYKIVTLDGQIVNIGGSITGGSNVKVTNVIKEKYELDNNNRKLETFSKDLETLNNELSNIQTDIKNKEIELLNIKNSYNEYYEMINYKNNNLSDLEEKLINIQNELKDLSSITKEDKNNELDRLLNEFNSSKYCKSNLEKELTILKLNKEKINNSLLEIESINKKSNTFITKKEQEKNILEIKTNRMEVKLDTLLLNLTEDYTMTYELAKDNYKLEIDEDIARKNVSEYKNILKEIGEVNTLAPSEYERVNTRYTFLTKQRQDLLNAEDTLNEIIKEMDNIMKDKFLSTFNDIGVEFKKVFRELFKGGVAEIYLTDPENILETGIEIKAEPPGKKLQSITLLSGGEKTFTAIALLFAILNVTPVPFCILDEVEAALDENNVDEFGNYLKKYEEKTQFILITHKKRTMEFIDTLYGITMQESGVSKLVSVKLEEIKK